MLKAFLVNIHYLPEEEYKKLDVAMSVYNYSNPYMFYCAIYSEGAIITIWHNSYDSYIEKTKNDFPNLYKLIEYTKKMGATYINLALNGTYIPEDTEEKHNLKRFNW